MTEPIEPVGSAEPTEAKPFKPFGNGADLTKYAWKKGQSGNPNGRPKGVTSLTVAMKKLLESETVGTGKAKKKLLDVLAKALVRQACRGNGRIAKEIWDRLDGKIPDEVIVTQSLADLIEEGLAAENAYSPEVKPD